MFAVLYLHFPSVLFSGKEDWLRAAVGWVGVVVHLLQSFIGGKIGKADGEEKNRFLQRNSFYALSKMTSSTDRRWSNTATQ